MKSAKLLAVLLLCSIAVPTFAQEELGVCDATTQRERKTAQYQVGSVNQQSPEFDAQKPCDGGSLRIKKCAVIAVRDQKVQRFCFPTDGKPQHDDYFDIVEYWDKPAP